MKSLGYDNGVRKTKLSLIYRLKQSNAILTDKHGKTFINKSCYNAICVYYEKKDKLRQATKAQFVKVSFTIRYNMLALIKVLFGC